MAASQQIGTAITGTAVLHAPDYTQPGVENLGDQTRGETVKAGTQEAPRPWANNSGAPILYTQSAAGVRSVGAFCPGSDRFFVWGAVHPERERRASSRPRPH